MKTSKTLQKLLDPSRTSLVLEAEYPERGSWVGAPAAGYSETERCFYLLARFRREGVRGGKTILYNTKDGINLKKVIEIKADSIGTRSIERGELTPF